MSPKIKSLYKWYFIAVSGKDALGIGDDGWEFRVAIYKSTTSTYEHFRDRCVDYIKSAAKKL